MLYTLDGEGRFRWIGGRATAILGWTPEEVVGKDAVTLLKADEAGPTARQRLDAKRSGREDTSTFEVRVVRKDGRTVWLHVTSQAVRAADGSLQAIHGIAVDVSGQRRAQDALARSQGRLDEFLEGLHDVVYLHDLAGHFLMVNEAGCRLFGYSREELLRRSIGDLVDPAHLERAREQTRLKVEGKLSRSAPYELLTRTKTGRGVWVEVSSSVIRADGKPVAIQGVARNINERKANEQALRLVQRIAAATQAADDFADVLAVACRGLGEATGCARVEGWVPNAEGGLHLQAAWPDQRSLQEEKFHRLSAKTDFERRSGLVERVQRDGCPVWVGDVQNEPSFVRAAAARAAGYHGLLAVPLMADGQMVAALLLFTSQAGEFAPPWQGLVESVASQLGVAMARRRAHDGADRRAQLLGLQMELAPVAMMLVGADGTLLGANHRFLELCGLGPAAALQPFDETFVSRLPNPQAFVAVARDVYESDRRGMDEVRLGERLLKRFVVDLPGPAGTPLGRAVFLRDITQERRLADDLRARRELSADGPGK